MCGVMNELNQEMLFIAHRHTRKNTHLLHLKVIYKIIRSYIKKKHYDDSRRCESADCSKISKTCQQPVVHIYDK